MTSSFSAASSRRGFVFHICRGKRLETAPRTGNGPAMTFRFIHSADWQLGKPFANFPPDLAGELSAARFNAIQRIAGVAAKSNASHVLVAGDVFDDTDLPAVTMRRAFERMAEHRGVTWVLLPGNHDPHRRGGLWDRAARLDLPPNVKVITAEAPLALSETVTLLPAPLTSKNPGRDPTAWMASADTPPGTIRIGLAHGSVQGFGSDGESAVLIDKDRARNAGLAYLALGDWHGTTKVSGDTWYAGTPEPDRFPANDPGNVLAVSLASGAPPKVEVVRTAEYHWSRFARDIAGIGDLKAIEREFDVEGATPARQLVRLALSGSLSMRERSELDAWAERWAGRLRYLQLDTAKIVARPSTADFDALGEEGPVAEAARRLAAIADDAANPEAQSAALALERLFGFAAEAAHEANA